MFKLEKTNPVDTVEAYGLCVCINSACNCGCPCDSTIAASFPSRISYTESGWQLDAFNSANGTA